MALYKYEMHLHTKEASACASFPAAKQVRSYKEAGYTGIITTDHFFNGNTNVPRDLGWNERIDLFCRGYENAKEEGDRVGLSVFFGLETGFKGTEFLIYGLDKHWLKYHSDMLSWTVEEQYQKVHEAGGFVVHAHPFRIRPHIKEIRLFPDAIDAVEVYNVRNQNEEDDKQALAYAEKWNLPGTAGTDAHEFEPIRSGIICEHKLENIGDFIDSIKARRYEIIKAFEENR